MTDQKLKVSDNEDIRPVASSVNVCRKKNYGKRWYVAAMIMCAVLFAGAISLFRLRQRFVIRQPETQQKAYCVGSVVPLDWGEVQYLSCTKGKVSFSCTNNGENDEILEFCIRGYLVSETIDDNNFICQNYRITTRGSAYDTDADGCMYDLFTIYVDGAETNEINIPNDRKAHVVVIDFQKFTDMGIELECVWELAQAISFVME